MTPIAISSPGKVLFPDAGVTKADLARYYERVADAMLPHVRGRPVHMQRFPDGIDGAEIHQKRVPDFFPDFVVRRQVPRKGGGTITHALIENAETLVFLADQACITPHVWLSRVEAPDCPDQVVVDLDPDDGDFGAVKDAARFLRDLLIELGLTPLVKATGSRGLHVVAPLDARAPFDEVRALARSIARLVCREAPERFTTQARKAKRRGRLYLDTARNTYAHTAVPPYAVRARPGAPVAVPLGWDELSRADLRPDRYTIANLFRRLAAKDNPWRCARPGAAREAAARLEALL
jgi:bifunctional non-homologous end joining protein LigD